MKLTDASTEDLLNELGSRQGVISTILPNEFKIFALAVNETFLDNPELVNINMIEK